VRMMVSDSFNGMMPLSRSRSRKHFMTSKTW
jgi:hypothetical protein